MIKLERIIIESLPVRFVINKSKKISLPGFEGLPLFDVVSFFLQQVRKVGLNDRAAAISFNLLMAIPASTIFLCTLIPYMPFSRQITSQLLLLTRDLTPDLNTFLLVKDFLVDFIETPRSGLLSFGFLAAIYYASNAVLGIMRTFNKSLMHSTKQNFVQSRWMAIKITTILILLILSAIILLMAQGTVLSWMLDKLNINTPFVNWLVENLRWVLIIALVYYSIAIIYKYVPSIHERWQLSSPGTIFATGLIIITVLGFTFWVNKFNNFNKVYGSIGTILILMLLIYFSSLVLLIGYELNVSIHSLKMLAAERERLEALETQKPPA
ncbi:YihY/virulence factor BrkB family protein [Flavihumibacter fluvii]|uniref:YihY/virulence factor BrkB family protein n=1 Tax=Flavihumibacter fluvii TaxID=2838157 RepID=UPI001BDEE38A|nr:YihY/virulence factor BrkB family protein [Flavihumibacter fluvii]ULQ54393.1 YihY/virulence factor BrkB family protein [Flavihumibacter fluvii]